MFPENMIREDASVELASCHPLVIPGRVRIFARANPESRHG
jgi:hypothetical protein